MKNKIVAILGPTTNIPQAMEGLIEAGVDMVRFNFSHGISPGSPDKNMVANQFSSGAVQPTMAVSAKKTL